MSRSRNLHTVGIVLVFFAGASFGFQPPLTSLPHLYQQTTHRSAAVPLSKLSGCNGRQCAFSRRVTSLDLFFRRNTPDGNHDGNDGSSSPVKKTRRRRRWRKLVTGLAALVLTSFAPLKYNVKSASASAPVMAIPKAEGRDPGTEAMLEKQRKQALEAQKELNEFAKEARQIEAEQGEAARIKFEKDYKANKARKAEEKAQGLIALKKELLAQGICPFVDMEGQRQVIAYRSGVDLANTPGTPFYMEKMLDKKNSKKAYSNRKEMSRKVIACMVQDMKNRDIDPLEYFEKHQDQTDSILELSHDKAAQLVERYTVNLEQYGQITVPKPGEMSAKEKIEARRDPKAEAKRLKEEKRAEVQRMKDEKKAKAAEVKAAQKAERERKKEEVKLEKENAKKGSKVAVAGAASSAVALGTSAMQDSATKIAGSLDSTVTNFAGGPGQDHSSATIADDRPSSSFHANSPSKAGKSSSKSGKSSLILGKIITPKAIAGITVVGGGAFAFKMMRDKAAADEIERQRQFELLMGNNDMMKIDQDGSDDFLDDEDAPTGFNSSPFPGVDASTPAPPPPKKRRLGISLFNKKSNRETDIQNLVAPSNPNANFASSLAKLLTFGAPGRFPSVAALRGSMPIDEYDLTAAADVLLEAKGDLSPTDMVELFASVVNCMLIDILDLASSALSIKNGKEEATIEALNIVVDFMNHAAELFGSVAGNEILIDPPVRYEGSLGKSKLEQMYGIYASAGSDMSMLFPKDGEAAEPSPNVRDDHDQRVAMLQDVFGISDKKAEGITMKAAQKTMMEMAKSGKMQEMIEQMGGAEGMEKMMQEMGGMEDMDPAMMEAMADPEKLLPELKRIQSMVEAGTFPKSELKDIQEQFKSAFGSDDIETSLLEGRDKADLTQTEQEFLDAMAVIMKAE